jgi:Skp family chaperone for outer membrane proteins
MKTKTAIVGVAIFVVALWATFEYSHAAPAATNGSLNIGVVSVRNVFNGSQQQAKYRNAVLNKQSQLQAQLESRAKDLEAAEAELKTFKPGTEDHLKQLQLVLKKRSELDSEQEFLKQKRNLEDKEWMEKLYQATLTIVADLAQEKGLDMVLERTEPQFPISAEELMATFSSHKVLYSGNCPDLTDEVVKRLDALESLQP